MAIPRGEVPTPSGGRTEQLWHDYERTGDPRVREELVMAATPLVKYCAGRIAVGLPPSVEMDDLISYGIFGLLDAVDKFDPHKGVKFETYAVARIRGAILDGLRAADWVPRSVRQKAREVERVVGRLENRLGRPATDEEVARELGVDVSHYHHILQDVQGAALLSLDEGWVDDSGELEYSLAQMVIDPSNQDPGQTLEMVEGRRRLAEAIAHLPERERLVISLYYYEGLTLKEIGAVLGVSESRVSQMHTKAILRLRAALRPTD